MMDLLNHKFFNYFSDTGAKALAEYVEEIPYNDQTVVFEEGVFRRSRNKKPLEFQGLF